MRIAICDDEKTFITRVYERITALSKSKNIDSDIQTFNTGTKLIEACKKEKFDAVFLDIAMPENDGFDIAKELVKICPDINLAFVSSQESLVFSSYEYSPLWFVPKSQLQLLETAINKIISKIEAKKAANISPSVKMEKNTIIKLDLKEIAYIKSTAHYLNIYYIDKKDASQSYRNSLDKIEEQLKDCYFVRCHNRYLVNCRNISTIQSNFCILHSEERIPISRNKMAATKSCFQNYLRSMK